MKARFKYRIYPIIGTKTPPIVSASSGMIV